MTTDDHIALVIGAPAELVSHVERCLSGWRCVSVDDAARTPEHLPDQGADLIVLYARKDPGETLAICERLRGAGETSGAPILLVIGRYLISQGHAVRRMGNADFIMTPFEAERIRRKVAAFFETSSA